MHWAILDLASSRSETYGSYNIDVKEEKENFSISLKKLYKHYACQ